MEDKIAVSTDQAAGPFGGAPYSQAIVSNGFVFTAGQIGAAADGSASSATGSRSRPSR